MDLFDLSQGNNLKMRPLADAVRPVRLSEFLGQEHILGGQRPLRHLIESGRFGSLILWGPPGCGKTTLANMLAGQMSAEFISLNAISAGAKILRDEGDLAHRRRLEQSRKTLLFIDEVHRLNKGQQDVLLPYIEHGDIIFVGATTENPSYELNAALLSRCQVVAFGPLDVDSLQEILRRASSQAGIGLDSILRKDAVTFLIEWANGDARSLLNGLERLLALFSEISGEQGDLSEVEQDGNKTHKDAFPPWGREKLIELLGVKPLRYDKGAEEHYNTISAFIKSIRGSDAQAGLYYLARMLAAGEDPSFIARRLIILASEDVGNADPQGLILAVNGAKALEMIGLPEGAIVLAQIVTYLALAPKSNRSYLGLKAAQKEVSETGSLEIPLSLRSGQTKFLKEFGYGKGYSYSHDGTFGWVPQDFMPKGVRSREFYRPVQWGYEKKMGDYQEWLARQQSSEESKK